MGRIKDFATKYAPKLFAIDPAFAGPLGWAILNENPEILGGDKKKPLVHLSGILQPFSNESRLSNLLELAYKLKEIWHQDAGFSFEPRTLIIERPIIYPGSPVKFISISDLNILVGILVTIVKPTQIIIPSPTEWKSNKSKENTRENVLSFCDPISLKNIDRDMQAIALDKQHNAFDAIGLGIYGLKVKNQEIPPPRLIY